MHGLIRILQENEEWLIKRILQYARVRNYTKYTSTLEEAWRISIQGVSASLIDLLEHSDAIPELDPDYDFVNDPVCAFGILEAKLHRERGISLEMFLGLFKYYKKTYLDLVEESLEDTEKIKQFQLFIERSFNRMEIAFCSEWVKISDQGKLEELQEKNRLMTNEKNKFLTIVESLNSPAILLNELNQIVFLNSSAVAISSKCSMVESEYYRSQIAAAEQFSKPLADALAVKSCIGSSVSDCFPWLKEFIDQFDTDQVDYLEGEASLVIDEVHLFFEVQLAAMKDVSGKFSGKILLLTNITKRKTAEEEKAALEERLQTAQKMEAVGRLAAGVANDFSNILAGINGYAEMIQAVLTEENPLYSDVEEIRKAGDRAAVLTSQLMAFGQKQAIVPKELALNELLSHSQRMLQRILGQDIELAIFSEKDTGLVKVDPAQIEQILVNLAVNSKEAMPEGGKIIIETDQVNIEVSSKTGREDKPFIMLSFSDTGHGMEEETIKRAFEPYFSTWRKGKGAGLGLSSIYGIVQQNHGFVRLYSEPGMGTTIKVYFPVIEKQTETAKTDDLNLEEARGSETVLLAEDEEILRTLAKRILTRQGYQVWEASNGPEAIKIAEKLHGKIDLLLTDVIMPKMNGKELHESILEIQPDIKTLFMSEYTENVIAHHGILRKEVNFLPKPFTINSLLTKVRSVLDS